MSKMSKKERNAKARAYAKKMTHGKVMDMYAAGGAATDRLLSFAEDQREGHLIGIATDYTGYDFEGRRPSPVNLVRGYGGAVSNAIERGVYKFLGITRPRTDPKTAGDIIDYISYHGAAGLHAYENRGDLRSANAEFYKGHFGINLQRGGWDAIQPEGMIMEKEVPYIIQKKIRQIPFIKKSFSKLNKAFGGF